MANTADTNIYKSLKDLRDFILKELNNFDRSYRYMMGERLFDKIIEANNLIRIANEEKDIEKRILDIQEVRYVHDEIEYLGDACAVHKILDEKKLKNFSRLLGEFGSQATAWLNYYKKKNKEK